MTPGQVAYEAMVGAMLPGELHPWEAQPEAVRRDWETTARAVVLWEREACVRDVWSAEGESTPGMPGWCLKREIEAAIRARGQ